MESIKNILVLTDFSGNAKSAEEYAVLMASAIKADILLYNVYPESGGAGSENLVWPHNKPILPELQSIDNLQASTDELKAKVQELPAGEYRPAISHWGNAGNLANNLNSVISRNNINLVVMGTKGEGFANTVIFGSNVFKVLDIINCPVLIIPGNYSFKNRITIAYATDLRSTDTNIITWLQEFTNLLKGQLLIAHVSPDAVESEEALTRQTTEQALSITPGNRPTIKYFQGNNVEFSLRQVIEKEHISVLAMALRKYDFFKRMFHESEIHHMIKNTELPVLIFPPFESEANQVEPLEANYSYGNSVY